MDTKERIAKALSVATDTKVFEMGVGEIAKAPEVFKKMFPGRKAVILTDHNNWRSAGERVWSAFNEASIPISKYIIDVHPFHAEWKYVEMTDKVLEGDFEAAKRIENDENHQEADPEKSFKEPDVNNNILISVGSGTINDLCKRSSYQHGQQYLTIPTAASVDGYSSFGASISYQHSKQTFQCSAPLAIVADIDVIANAPKEMTAAGYADLAAKIPAGGEWIIADFVGRAPIIPEAWHVLQDVLNDQLSNPEGVARGDHEAVANLFEGLTLSGFAMQAARSSRPASCCDHLFSHIMDMTGHKYKGKLQSHGFQVAIGTLTMCAVFDELFKQDLTKIDVDKCVAAWPTKEQEEKRALEIFKNFPDKELGFRNVGQKYQDADVVRDQLIKLKSEWPELKQKLQNQVYTFNKMQDLLKRANAPYDPSMIGLSRKDLHAMFPIVQLMRHRFNLLDLAKRGCFYDAIVEPIFAKGGPLDETID